MKLKLKHVASALAGPLVLVDLGRQAHRPHALA